MQTAMLLVSSRSIFVLIRAELQYKEVLLDTQLKGNIIRVYFVNVPSVTSSCNLPTKRQFSQVFTTKSRRNSQ